MPPKTIVTNYLYGSTLAGFSIVIGYGLSWLMNSFQLNTPLTLIWLEIGFIFLISAALYGLASGIATWSGESSEEKWNIAIFKFLSFIGYVCISLVIFSK